MTETGGRQRVAVVTGGGGGIGTAVALELARQGVAVVAMDPGVGVQGEPLNEPTAAQTAQLITAAGGVARASTASVTDRAAVRSLFAGVVAEFGGLDIVVNTAGILRFAPFLTAAEDDWRAVLGVHLDGYLNVLAEALPHMQAAGYGRIVGVTSGAGLARAAADNAPYSSAKRAVAAVTWQLAGLLPSAVALNALSPLAATRMITSALTGGRPADRTRSGGLDLSGMPAADDMGPAAAFLASEAAGSLRGQIIFSAGPELSVISPPQLIEAIRTDHTADFAASLDTLVPVVIGPAEAAQRSTGGSNARFGPVFDQPGTAGPVADPDAEPRYALVVAENAAVARALAAALARCGLTAVDPGARPVLHWPSGAPADPLPAGFADVDAALSRAEHITGGLAAVVIAPGPFAGTPRATPSAAPADARPAAPADARPAAAADARPATAAGDAPPGADPSPAAAPWTELLDGFAPVTEHVLAHVAWLQAAARLAVRTSRPLRIVHLADATSAPRQAAAQAVAQLARCATLSEPGLIDVFSLAVETASPADHDPVAQLVARLLWSGDTTALRGAELFARPGWIGLRAHPAPLSTVSYGTAALPPWIGDWLRQSTAPTHSLLVKYLSVNRAPRPRAARAAPEPPAPRSTARQPDSPIRSPPPVAPAPSRDLAIARPVPPPRPCHPMPGPSREPATRTRIFAARPAPDRTRGCAGLCHPPRPGRHPHPRPRVIAGYRVDLFETIVGLFTAETEVASMTGIPDPGTRSPGRLRRLARPMRLRRRPRGWTIGDYRWRWRSGPTNGERDD